MQDNKNLLQILKEDELNTSLVKLYSLFPITSEDIDKKLNEYITSTNKEVFSLSQDSKKETLLSRTKTNIQEEALFFNEIVEKLEIQNIAKQKYLSLGLDDVIQKASLEKKLDELRQSINSFDYTLLGFVNIDSKEELEALLDKVQSLSEKSARNLSLESIAQEKLEALEKLKGLNKDQNILDFIKSYKQDIYNFSKEQLQESLLDSLISKAKLEEELESQAQEEARDATTRGLQTKEDISFFNLIKKIYNATVVNTAKIMKLH